MDVKTSNLAWLKFVVIERPLSFILLTLFSSSVLLLSLLRSLGIKSSAYRSIESTFGGDKQLHFISAFILTLLLYRLISIFIDSGKGLIFNASIVITLCAFDESAQYFSEFRQLSWLDFISSVSGVLLATVIIGLVIYIHPNSRK